MEGVGDAMGKGGERGTLQAGLSFQTYLTKLLLPLNSVGWEFRTMSDRSGLASDLWHDLGRFIVPCCVSLSHSRKKKESS